MQCDAEMSLDHVFIGHLSSTLLSFIVGVINDISEAFCHNSERHVMY